MDGSMQCGIKTTDYYIGMIVDIGCLRMIFGGRNKVSYLLICYLRT